MVDWKKEMAYFTIMYRMLECKEEIPVITEGTDYDFIAQELEDLNVREMININPDTGNYTLTQKGRDTATKLICMYDQVAKFEVFSSVNVAMPLSEDEVDDTGLLMDQFYDPRFQCPKTDEEMDEYGTEDMRMAMINFLCEEMATDLEPLDLDPHRVVFIQLLATGKLKSKDVWFNLKLETFFKHVQEIVDSAYQWRDTDPDSEESSVDIMRDLYTAGMLEQRKRDGFECSGCSTPLAVFEMNEKADGGVLTNCPNPECGASFEPPPPDYNCPSCQGGVTKTQTTCTGCGALLDWAMPPGTIQEETIEETVEEPEPVWSGTYDYTPYGYYDPYDPYMDIVTFGVVCAVLW